MGDYGLIFFIGLLFISSSIGSMTTPSIGFMVFGGGLMFMALISFVLERKQK